jgi:argininosuccinate synthase
MTKTSQTGAKPIVLAYSGGLDTSFLVPWVAENYQRPIITVTVDTGGIDAAAARLLRQRSAALGAIEHHQVDARADYFEQVLRFLIMGNVRRGQLYPLCVGAERVMQAQTVARMARTLGSDTIAHGCTAAGNDQVRFEVAMRTLAPDLEVLAPVRDRAFKRSEELEYLQQRSLPVPPFGAAYSINRGLWGVTIGGKEKLEKLVLTPRQQRIKESVAQPYGDLVHEGQLLDPVCRDIEALLLSSQQRVSGEVHLLLRPGSLFVEGVESPYSLMAASKGVYGEAAGEWTPTDALGFSKIVALTGVFNRRAGEAAAQAGQL